MVEILAGDAASSLASSGDAGVGGQQWTRHFFFFAFMALGLY